MRFYSFLPTCTTVFGTLYIFIISYRYITFNMNYFSLHVELRHFLVITRMFSF